MKTFDEIYFTPAGSPVSPDAFDVRIRMRLLSRGLLSQDDLQKYLKSLPDDAASGEFRNYDALVKDESNDETSPVSTAAVAESTPTSTGTTGGTTPNSGSTTH